MGKYADLFVDYLQKDCGYPENVVIKNVYRYDGKDYDRVEVLWGDLIIQAFVLMSKDHCLQLDKFPFYRTYSQQNEYGYLVQPACNVVVYEGNDTKYIWHIHNASNLRAEVTHPGFLNYEKAVNRYRRRFEYLGNKKLYDRIKMLSIILLAVFVLYVVAHILSVNGIMGNVSIPLDASIISTFIIVICLLLIPPLMPYIRSLGIGSVGIEIKDSKDKK